MRSMLLLSVLTFGAPADPQAPGIVVDKEKKTVRVPCKIAPRKLPNLTEIYPIEVIATWPTPKGQKAHETIVIFDVLPSDVHKALESLGLKAGKPGRGEETGSGPECELFIELPGAGGAAPKLVTVASVLIDKRTGRALPRVHWHFTGSVLVE